MTEQIFLDLSISIDTERIPHRSCFPVARVVLNNFLPEEVPVDMGIYLSSRDLFMSQHLLDYPDIGPLSSRWVANECRNTCGLISFLMPAASAYCLM